MQLTLDDAIVYLYNAGVVLSGGWAIQLWAGDDRLLLVAVSGVLALGWTLYFWWSVAPRLNVQRGVRPDDEEDREDRSGPREAR